MHFDFFPRCISLHIKARIKNMHTHTHTHSFNQARYWGIIFYRVPHTGCHREYIDIQRCRAKENCSFIQHANALWCFDLSGIKESENFSN